MNEKKQTSVEIYAETFQKLQAIQTSIEEFAKQVDKAILLFPVNWEFPIRGKMYPHFIGVTPREVRKMKRLRRKFIQYGLRQMFKHLSKHYELDEDIFRAAEPFSPFIQGIIYEDLQIEKIKNDECNEGMPKLDIAARNNLLEKLKKYEVESLTEEESATYTILRNGVNIILKKDCFDRVLYFFPALMEYPPFKEYSIPYQRKLFEFIFKRIVASIINPACNEQVGPYPFGSTWHYEAIDIFARFHVASKLLNLFSDLEEARDIGNSIMALLDEEQRAIHEVDPEKSLANTAFKLLLLIFEYDKNGDVGGLAEMIKEGIRSLKDERHKSIKSRPIDYEMYSVAMQDESGQLLTQFIENRRNESTWECDAEDFLKNELGISDATE